MGFQLFLVVAVVLLLLSARASVQMHVRIKFFLENLGCGIFPKKTLCRMTKLKFCPNY